MSVVIGRVTSGERELSGRRVVAGSNTGSGGGCGKRFCGSVLTIGDGNSHARQVRAIDVNDRGVGINNTDGSPARRERRYVAKTCSTAAVIGIQIDDRGCVW